MRTVLKNKQVNHSISPYLIDVELLFDTHTGFYIVHVWSAYFDMPSVRLHLKDEDKAQALYALAEHLVEIDEPGTDEKEWEAEHVEDDDMAFQNEEEDDD